MGRFQYLLKLKVPIQALKTHRQIDNSWIKFLVARDRGMPLINAAFEAIIFSVLRLLGVQCQKSPLSWENNPNNDYQWYYLMY